MDRTANYGLNKPGQEDFYDVGDFNENADAIDAELAKQDEKSNKIASDMAAAILDALMTATWGGTVQDYSGNLNDINSTCFVYAKDGANKPTSSYGFCFTCVRSSAPDSVYKIQLFQSAATNDLYVRWKSPAKWAAWVALITGDALATALEKIKTMAEQGAVWCGTGGGNGNNFALTTGRNMAKLADGQRFSFFADRTSSAPTVKVDALEPVAVKKGDGSAASKISPGVQTIVYTQGFFFAASGAGGEYGTAGAAQVLDGYTVGTDDGLVAGSMPDIGAVSKTLTAEGESYAPPKGYHNGNGAVKTAISNLTAANVKQGAKVGGIDGNFTNDATAVAADVVKDKTAYVKGSKVTGTLALSGDAAVGDVKSGKTYYNTTLTKQTGTLALLGDAVATDVKNGKKFYSNDFTQKTGSLALSGDAAAGDVASGKKFYSNDFTLRTGTLANRGSPTFTPTGVDQAIPAGNYSGGTVKAVPGGVYLISANVGKGTYFLVPKNVVADYTKIRAMIYAPADAPSINDVFCVFRRSQTWYLAKNGVNYGTVTWSADGDNWKGTTSSIVGAYIWDIVIDY